MKQQKGFTLVELLVAVGIIGVLAGITVVSVGNVRQRARDSKRVADVKQIQASLEQQLNNAGTYPTLAAAANIGGRRLCGSATASAFADAGAACAQGSTAVLEIPPSVSPPAGDRFMYSYLSADGATYTINFGLEAGAGPLTAAGCYQASPQGIRKSTDSANAATVCAAI